MMDGYKDTDNPAGECIVCDKFIGMRGFCSQECHDKYYDDEKDSSKTSINKREIRGTAKKIKVEFNTQKTLKENLK